jgi:large subunit ribosomal protein L24e
MVERRVCTFCGEEIEPGTGRMYVKKDGVIYQFCTSKCYKNLIKLGRVPRRTTWTRWHEHEKEVRMKGVTPPEPKTKPKKVRKQKAEAPGEPKPEEKPSEDAAGPAVEEETEVSEE